MKTYENLIKKAKTTSNLTWQESVDLVQWLLDTDKDAEYPEFEKLCSYYLQEGLAYYVPTAEEES